MANLVLIEAGFYMFFSVYFLTSSFYKRLDLAEETAFSHLENVTKNLAFSIDGDKYSRLMSTHKRKDDIKTNFDDEYYNDLHELLAYFKDFNELETDIYTWVVDTSYSGELEVKFGVTSGEIPYFRHEWRNFPEKLLHFLPSGGRLEDYHDENGHWISCFSPILNSSGEVVGAIQADISYEGFVSEIRMDGLKGGMVLLLTVFFFLVILLWVMDKLQKKQKILIETQVKEDKYREILDVSNDFIFLISADGKINYANKVLLDCFEDDVVGSNIVNIVSESHKDAMLSLLNNLPRKTVFEANMRMGIRGRMWLEMDFVPIKIEESKIGYQISARDVTENKKLKFNLEKEKVKALQSLKSKENFFATMSHEIRTPLNAIIGMGNLINKDALETKEKEYLSKIKLSAKGLLQIINDILDYSKIEAGKLNFESYPFQVKSIFESAQRTFQFKFEEKGLDFDLVASKDDLLQVVYGDLLRINQVVLNLVSNALKFTSEGAVVLRVKIIGETQKWLEVEVEDSGIGIPDDRQWKLFESFNQISDDVTRKYGGTGLGLSICKKIVNLQKGEIHVSSVLGEGSVFSFKIPLELGELEDLPVNDLEINEQEQLPIMSVLVAEDNPINMVYITGVLEEAGVMFNTVENGKEAVDELREKEYDVILMDVQMPEMDGYTATRLIRDSLKLNTPIIALTANAFPEDKKRVEKAGMNGFISKPFEPEELFGEIKRVLKDINFKPKTKKKSNQDTKPVDSNNHGEYYSLEKLELVSRGNKAFVQKMVQVFLEETPGNIKLFENLLANKEFSALGQLAHKMKPTIDMFNIFDLKNVIRDIEKEVKNESIDIDLIERKTMLVIKLLTNVLGQIRKED